MNSRILILAALFAVIVSSPSMALDLDFSPAGADSVETSVEVIEGGDYDVVLLRDAIQYYITVLQTLKSDDDPATSAEWALNHRYLFDILALAAVGSKDSLARMSCLTLWIEYTNLLEAGFKAK